ncbi:MAG: HEAT repeat domain-containing protein [Candidatus Latescibacterota bacterium]|nr:HEAT repeat domain-containing protein [Candidatus Latescibacterota bacterium]
MRKQIIVLIAFLTGCTTTEQQISDLVEQMAGNPIESPTWTESVENLATIGRPAARLLISQLNPGHYVGKNYREFRLEIEKLRTGSARVLGEIKPRGAAGPLKDRIGTAYTDSERIACIWALGEIGFNQAGIDALQNILSDNNPLIRLHTAIALVKMDNESGYEEIQKALAGKNKDLREIAQNGLRESSYFGVPILTRLMTLQGSQQKILIEISHIIGDELIDLLDAEDPETRRRSSIALGILNEMRFEKPLLACLEDASNQVKFSAAASLASIGSKKGIDFLFESMRNEDPILRSNAVKFLAEVQHSGKTVQEQLINSMQDANPLSRAGAAQVLGLAKVVEAVAPLELATKDKNATVRANAIIALGHIGRLGSQPHVKASTQDTDATVAYYAKWALSRLTQHK